ncbi:hypothetical protein AB2M62_10565 [Sphingomonas sp. MMS12-HWE2-04]|uniref:hypothetical protein n=1 Tax=Sphingomonas sp. MMS12-HWE2-04 TaxID=3234199 RepID=UPI00385167B9
MNIEILEASLQQAALKVYRANRHIREAQHHVAQHSKRDFYKIIKEGSAYSADQRFIAVAESIPLDVPLAIGDTFHCLSTALDYIATGLVESVQGDTTRISFPSHNTRDALRQSFKAPRNGASPPNRRIVEALPRFAYLLLARIRPYAGGGMNAWEVRKADNIDKHNIVMPTITITHISDVKMVDNRGGSSFHFGSVTVGDSGEMHLIDVGRGSGEVNVLDYGRATFEVRFPVGLEVFGGEPVFPTLTHCAESIQQVIELVGVSYDTPTFRY